MKDETYVKMYFGKWLEEMSQHIYNYFCWYFAIIFRIWLVIFSCGQKTLVFVTNASMQSKLYAKECLKTHISNHQTLQRPCIVLASYCNRRETFKWYRDNRVSSKRTLTHQIALNSSQSRNIGQLFSGSWKKNEKSGYYRDKKTVE